MFINNFTKTKQEEDVSPELGYGYGVLRALAAILSADSSSPKHHTRLHWAEHQLDTGALLCRYFLLRFLRMQQPVWI